MAQYTNIRVRTDLGRRRETKIVSAHSDGSINYLELGRLFPGAIGLAYKDGSDVHMLRLEANRLVLGDGKLWDPNKVYLVQYGPNSSTAVVVHYPAGAITSYIILCVAMWAQHNFWTAGTHTAIICGCMATFGLCFCCGKKHWMNRGLMFWLAISIPAQISLVQFKKAVATDLTGFMSLFIPIIDYMAIRFWAWALDFMKLEGVQFRF